MGMEFDAHDDKGNILDVTTSLHVTYTTAVEMGKLLGKSDMFVDDDYYCGSMSLDELLESCVTYLDANKGAYDSISGRIRTLMSICSQAKEIGAVTISWG